MGCVYEGLIVESTMFFPVSNGSYGGEDIGALNMVKREAENEILQGRDGNHEREGEIVEVSRNSGEKLGKKEEFFGEEVIKT